GGGKELPHRRVFLPRDPPRGHFGSRRTRRARCTCPRRSSHGRGTSAQGRRIRRSAGNAPVVGTRRSRPVSNRAGNSVRRLGYLRNVHLYLTDASRAATHLQPRFNLGRRHLGARSRLRGGFPATVRLAAVLERKGRLAARGETLPAPFRPRPLSRSPLYWHGCVRFR